jgi:hypothetical protein
VDLLGGADDPISVVRISLRESNVAMGNFVEMDVLMRKSPITHRIHGAGIYANMTGVY